MGSSKKYSNGYWKVYVHTNKSNGKKYVGITSQKPEYRWNYGKAYNNNPYFSSAIKKYGWDGFDHVVLYDFLSKDEAQAKEQELIAAWNTRDREYGYNITAGGEGTTGFVPSKELRELWSKIRTGTKRSQETRQKMSESAKRLYENRRKDLAEAKYKPVKMYNVDGTYIKTFESIIAANKELGLKRSHIGAVCKGDRKTCAGYIWEYA